MQSTATKPISTATVSIENYLLWEKWTDYPKVGRFCRRVKDRQPHFVPCLACLFIIPAPIETRTEQRCVVSHAAKPGQFLICHSSFLAHRLFSAHPHFARFTWFNNPPPLTFVPQVTALAGTLDLNNEMPRTSDEEIAPEQPIPWLSLRADESSKER
jgi:hypothetical protein